jgi:methyl-accepting chemotaxis protein
VYKLTKLKYKLLIAIITTSFVMVAILGGYSIFDQIRNNKKEIAEYRATLLQQFDRTNKVEVETAYSLVQDIYSQQQAGVLSEVDAKKRAADLVRNLRFDGDSYFWIDTTEGVNVVLLGRDAEGKSRINAQDPNGTYFIQNIIKAGMQPGGGYSEWMFPKPNEKDPTPKRGYSFLFSPYKWVIGTGNWIDDFDKVVAIKQAEYDNKLKWSIGISVSLILIALLLAGLMAIYISKRITDPIILVSESVREVAAGNLGSRDITIGSCDEIGVLAGAFNQMKENLRQLVMQVAGSAEQVASSSEELTAISEQAALASNQVAAVISDMARGGDSQVKAVDDVSSVIEKISASIQQIAVSAKEVAEASNESAATAKTGGQAVSTAITQMANIESAVVASAEVVSKLGDRSKEIGQIVETISGIAGQTNLLALNAAIEAARAGEQGRGFAVVAEEVRKLAEQSQDAAKEIAVLIAAIQTDTEKAVQVMQDGTHQTKIGSGVVGSAGEAFKEITKRINQVSSQITDISAAIGNIAAGSQEVVRSVRDIEKITRDSAGQTQTVSAATEEQSASMQEIAASSLGLSKSAQELQNVVSKFSIA